MFGAYFLSDGDALVPQAHSHGPWSTDMLHGRLLGGLAARAVEQLGGGEPFVPARLTVDLFKVAPMQPVTVRAEVVREGRRIRVIDASLHCAGHAVARASAVLLRGGEAPPGNVWKPAPWQVPHPETLDATGLSKAEAAAWEFRVMYEGFESADRAAVWTRERAPLVDDEPLSPFVRTALSADVASPLANSGDDGLHFINADFSLSMSRLPQGEWIGLEALQHQADGGIALGACTLYDLSGPFATSTTVALANPPLRQQERS